MPAAAPSPTAACRAPVERAWRAGLGGFRAPAAVLDAAALRGNLGLLRARSHGLPIRIATKSVRHRGVLDLALAQDGFAGLMAFSLAEALWLARVGRYDDILLAYPSVDRAALAELAADPEARARVTVMVDDPAHLGLIAQAARECGARDGGPVKVCLDVDASLRLGPAHLGARRSPLRTPEQAASAASRIAATPGVRLEGVMFYDAQIAGLPDTSLAVRAVKAASNAELRRRRTAVVAAVEARLRAAGAPPLRLVNGGGSGSLHLTGADGALTELAAGSGLFAPTSFDGYRGWSPTPALFVVLPIVRAPAPGIVTAFGGGYVASGAAGASRLPTPVWPAGLRLLGAEGAGEVQTPLRLRPTDRVGSRRTGSGGGRSAAGDVSIGDLAWLRPTKAGEPLERFDRLWIVDEDGSMSASPTYRGEGRCFG